MPIELFPINPNEFKKKFIEKGVANMLYYYSDGRVEKKIWRKGNFTENSDVMGNLRSRPEARKGKWQQMGIIKLRCEILND
jgi:hypothetical protein